MKTKLVKNVCKAVALSITVGTMLVSNGIVVNAQPKEMKDGTVFDAEYYASRYADVVAVYGTDEAALFQHYSDYGKSENREAVKTPSTKTFDPVYYAKQNPDVVAVYGTGNNNLYQHYLQFGKTEGRKPTANSSSTAASSANAPEQKAAATETAAPASEQNTAPAQTQNTISDEEAVVIFQNYLNNLVANTPESVCAFFDTDGNYNIVDAEMAALIAWTFDNYNTVNKSTIDKDEMIVIGRAIHDGTLKRPDSPYYVEY